MQGWAGLRSSGTERLLLVAQGVVLLLAAVLAFVFLSGGLPFLVLLLSGSAVVTGALELVSGMRSAGPVAP